MAMKALVYYGPEDLRLSEIADVMPAAGEVLIRVMACGICGSDVHVHI
jgi:threonine dehydrogenase-like Zn-dependent dehydrogenase